MTSDTNSYELEDSPCPIGCDRDDEPVLEGRDQLQGLPGTFRVVRCRGCGLMRTNPRPTPRSIGAYYPDDYGPYVGTREVSARDTGFMAALRRLAGSNSHALPDIPPGRALEIGCASGSFLRFLSEAGWEAEGIEFSESAAAFGRELGFRVHAGSLEDAPDPDKPFDLCVGWMVLEHLHEPVSALRKLWKWTRPGGWLAISVPNSGSLEFSIFGRNWYALHLPNHLYHPDTRTVARLLGAGGWRIEKVLHQRTIANLVGSVGIALREKGIAIGLAEKLARYPDDPGVFHRVLLPFSWIMAALGQTGRMTVWARREEDPCWPD